MKKKILIPVFFVIISGLFIVFKSNNFPDEKVYEFIGESKDVIVLHKEQVENGLVIFYTKREDTYNVNARFIKKNLLEWNTTNDGAYFTWGPKDKYHGPTNYFFPTSYHKDKSPFPMIMGAIQNPKVKSVAITYDISEENKRISAKMVNKEGRRFYFVFLEKPKSQTTYKIIKYDANGKVIEQSKVEAHFPEI